jgi:hypothetical protein
MALMFTRRAASPPGTRGEARALHIPSADVAPCWPASVGAHTFGAEPDDPIYQAASLSKLCRRDRIAAAGTSGVRRGLRCCRPWRDFPAAREAGAAVPL